MSDPLSDSLRWALEVGVDPTRTSIDWLAGELVPESWSAAGAILMTDGTPQEHIDRLNLLKNGFKTLRISAEEPTVRRLAAQYYVAAIAAGLVRHDEWITTQRPERVQRAIEDMIGDDRVDASLRQIGREAVAILEARAIEASATD